MALAVSWLHVSIALALKSYLEGCDRPHQVIVLCK